jgi:hypothetical protein
MISKARNNFALGKLKWSATFLAWASIVSCSEGTAIPVRTPQLNDPASSIFESTALIAASRDPITRASVERTFSINLPDGPSSREVSFSNSEMKLSYISLDSKIKKRGDLKGVILSVNWVDSVKDKSHCNTSSTLSSYLIPAGWHFAGLDVSGLDFIYMRGSERVIAFIGFREPRCIFKINIIATTEEP